MPHPSTRDQVSRPAPSGEEVRAELERLAASDSFRRAELSLRLLRHITNTALEGRGAELKEYTLGVSVFDRPDSFDPRIDPVVRLQVRRLRLKQAEYYQHEGADDAVIIDLPKGAYVPEFRFRRPSAAEIEAPAESTVKHPPRLRLAGAGMILLLVAAVIFSASFRNGPPARPSVAVLPFRDVSSHRELGYLADGFRDGLISTLVRTKGLEITARLSSGQVVDQGQGLAALARSVHADAVVSGSVTSSGGAAQVAVFLVDAKTGHYLWSQTYPAAVADLAIAEHRAASEIAHTLGAVTEAPAPNLPQNAEAAEMYLRACSLSRTRQPAQMQEAARLFEQSIGLQPEFAPAYAAAASNYLVGAQNSVMRWRDAGPRGIELALQAVVLDPGMADAHAALALGWQAQWEWRESEEELSRAIALDPRSPVPHLRRAYTLAVVRRFPEAEHEAQTARALDPAWSAAHGMLGEIYLYEGRYGEALELARHLRDSAPEFFDSLSGRVYVAEGRWDLARPFLEKSPAPLEHDLARAVDGDVRGAYTDLVQNWKASKVPAYHVACFSVLQLHDRQATLHWLEQSLQDHDPDLVSLGLDPMFEGIRGDPRAVAILRVLHVI